MMPKRKDWKTDLPVLQARLEHRRSHCTKHFQWSQVLLPVLSHSCQPVCQEGVHVGSLPVVPTGNEPV